MSTKAFNSWKAGTSNFRIFGLGHVAHHFFFSKIPHYHLLEATESIKKVINLKFSFSPSSVFLWTLVFQILEPLKDTPYGYKSETNYDFFFRYLLSNIRLDYLIHKSKGVLQYRKGVELTSKKNWSVHSPLRSLSLSLISDLLPEPIAVVLLVPRWAWLRPAVHSRRQQLTACSLVQLLGTVEFLAVY